MKIGVLGGTFDPIHVGHLVVAEECWARANLDLVLFMPAGEPPHKMNRVISPAADRVAMVRLAIEGNPHFELSSVEVDRVGPSYTVDTLAELRAHYGEHARILWIVGGDMLADIPRWHRPARLFELAEILAVRRPGSPEPDLQYLAKRIPQSDGRVHVAPAPWLAISGSDIRRRVSAGLPIKYQVPEAVESYTRRHGLYLREPNPDAEARVGRYAHSSSHSDDM